MRSLSVFALLLPLTLAASAPAQAPAVALDAALADALGEQRTATGAARKYRHMADEARGAAERLAAQQAAAGEALAAAEAGITAADARLRLAAAAVAAHRARLAEQQRPAANLLAGLALMARQPPLLALADRGSADDLVRVRVLIDATVPAIRARTARLSGQLAQGRRLAAAAISSRADLATSRRDLLARRTEFATLEQRALHRAAAAGGQSLSAGDAALSAGEDIARLRSGQSGARTANALAAMLAAEDPAPARPVPAEGARPRAPFDYALPSSASVSEGLGAVSPSGVRSRGLTLATARGSALTAPAAGTVRYAGPFRDYDGVIIIDHGAGWLSLIVNAAPDVARGSRVVLGQPLGRALGAVQVELSQNGRPISPALIAGSSQRMSNRPKGG
ncbi:MAG: peptidoglycan DD-metalloendopeptidase family protein [Sphingomicrobium sp.]